MYSSRGTQRYGHSRLYKPFSRRGVMMLGGATSTRDAYFDSNALQWPTGEVSLITNEGFAVGSIDNDGWGNDTLIAALSTLRTNGQATYFGAGKVHLVGVSGGGLGVLNWAKNNPTLVQSISLLNPALDVQHIYTNNVGGYASSISTAYGGGAPDDAHNPIDNLASFTGFPILTYYSSTDPYTPLAQNEAFGALSNVESYNMGALGHWSGPPYSSSVFAAFIVEND